MSPARRYVDLPREFKAVFRGQFFSSRNKGSESIGPRVSLGARSVCSNPDCLQTLLYLTQDLCCSYTFLVMGNAFSQKSVQLHVLDLPSDQLIRILESLELPDLARLVTRVTNSNQAVQGDMARRDQRGSQVPRFEQLRVSRRVVALGSRPENQYSQLHHREKISQ